MKNYEKNTASYEKATELNPWSFRDYFNLGRVYQLMEKFRRAAKAYVKACELTPDHLDAHTGAATSYYKIEDYNNALVYGRLAEQIDPNAGDIQKVLGDIYTYGLRNDYDQAIRSYKRALEMDSNNPEIMTSLAVAYLKAGHAEPAKELLTSVTQIQPDKAQAYNYLGFYYLQRYDQANKKYENEQKEQSGDMAVLASLIVEMKTSMADAIASYSSALELNNKDWEAHK